MLTLSATEPHPQTFPVPRSEPALLAGAAATLSVLGVLSIWSAAGQLWSLWTTDPLKSVGMLVPAVSLALILRAWRSIGWAQEGSWWGLALLLATAAAVHFREQSVLMLVLTPRWNLYFPPLSTVAFVYVLGVVLLFGGTPLYQAARFPVWLVLLVNPVPHIFSLLVDLPLQHLSAHVARGFAHMLHQPLTPDQLRLMFTPEFGMFIAPGCNGIRGAVTMGMIALVAGYLYRFRVLAHGLFVAAAILLGYVFNVLRLCALVLYYIVALHWTWLQDRAEMGDYVIGGCLFLLGAGLLFFVLRYAARPALPVVEHAVAHGPDVPAQLRDARWRLLAMAALVLLSGLRVALPISGANTTVHRVGVQASGLPLPRIGDYGLARTWTEEMPGGPVVFRWADYVPTAQKRAVMQSDIHASSETETTHVAVGVSPVLGSHESSICHSARGEDPVWTEEFVSRTADGDVAHFHASFFASGARQWLELATLCNGDRCGEYSTGARRIGLVYSHPAAVGGASAQSPDRPIPVLLTAETADTSLPADVARDRLVLAMRSFLSQTRVPDLTRPYR